MRDYSLIYLNGVRREVRGRDALLMLADWLRREEGLPGTKIVCAEGDCGACTVLRSFGGSEFEAVNACITTVAQMDCSHIVSVEAMARNGELAPAQRAMAECHGSQCGYCTPGFVMALSAMLERHESAPAKTVANYLTGNLCRCTGYSQIIDAGCAARASTAHSVSGRFLEPAAVVAVAKAAEEPFQIAAGSTSVYAPTTLRSALALAGSPAPCRVIAGATDLGVQINKGAPWPQILLSLHLVRELNFIRSARRHIEVGACATLAQLRRACGKAAPEFARFLDLFASPQIKNVATLAGNVANASPIGDTLPFLLVAGGAIHVASRALGRGPIARRVIPLTELFAGYRTLAVSHGEIITHISFDQTVAGETLRLFKVSQRRDLDISAVNAAFAVTRSDRPLSRRRSVADACAFPMIASARVAYGGIAATPLRLGAIEEMLVGELTPHKVESIAAQIAGSIAPISDVRGSADYRRVVAANMFRRFARELADG
ncbi:MAG: 2Fe-2S iron-sulfur cluster binding domain-containing protein [Phycisphaerales bacterium]|nr:2Fe-2S iron-sulfur cluster binding domain-containing protein [Phycisphaerales bacterium]